MPVGLALRVHPSYRMSNHGSNAPINGGGQPTGSLKFSGFKKSISPPLGLQVQYVSNSFPWGELKGIFKDGS